MNSYKNVSLLLINDHVVRLAVMTEVFYLPYHPDSDEPFLVMEGILYNDQEGRAGSVKLPD